MAYSLLSFPPIFAFSANALTSATASGATASETVFVMNKDDNALGRKKVQRKIKVFFVVDGPVARRPPMHSGAGSGGAKIV